MKKINFEHINFVLKTIQDYALILFLIFGCIFFVVGTASLLPSREYKKPEHEIIEEVIVEPVVVVEEELTPEEIMMNEFDNLSSIKDKKEWFIAYKEFCDKYPMFDRPQTLYERYTEDEIYLMQRVIETEVYGCNFDAKSHVASVIINRIEGDNNFPNDATKVCTAPGQFVYGRKNISEDTKLALEYAFEIEDTTNGALYFNSMKPMESWNGRTLIFTDEVGHSFY